MEKQICILHLEDDPIDSELVQASLAHAGLADHIIYAQTRDEFESALFDDGPDIILADYQLPTYDGMSALRLANEHHPDIPFIFVSGAMGEEVAIEALTQGATDYVLKHNLSRLASAVRRALQEAENRRQRKQAERQVALMSFALNGIHEAAFLIDKHARFHYVNNASCRILGYGRDELLALTVAQIDPDFPEERWREHWKQLKAQQTLTSEGRHQAKDGRIIPVEINANYFEYEGQGYNLALVRDISERKQMESERLINLNFFESMDQINRTIQGARDMESLMSDGLDIVLSIFDCDRAYLMYPCDPDADSWTSPMERTKPDYPGVLTLGLVLPMTPEVEQSTRIILDTDRPVKFGPGTKYPLPPDVAARFGFKCFMAMALYPKVGQPWQFGIHQCSHVRIWTQEEERVFQEIGRRLADGLTSWLTFRDLQKSERRYRQLNQELEQRVTERTQEVEASHADLEAAYRDLQAAHSRMLQQEKMASIGQLAAGVAHEINNPLAFMISNLGTLGGYSEELTQFHQALETALGSLCAELPGSDTLAKINRMKETMDIDFILEDIENIVAESLEGGNRMKEIVQNLKNFARLDEQEYNLADLNQGLESTLNIVWNELKYKVKVTKSYGKLPETICNLGQLNQVFMNLLINAAQAIEDQGEIAIATRRAGDTIVIEIADTGCGIAPDDLSRIFEPFYTTKEVGKGIGLGLSIVYDIVEKHAGEIAVESRPGQGSRFTISLPIRSE